MKPECKNCKFESDGVPACVMDGICPLNIKMVSDENE